MSAAVDVANAVLNVALAAAQTITIFIPLEGRVRKSSHKRSSDFSPRLIVSPGEEKEMPHGGLTRKMERTFDVAIYQDNDGKLQDLDDLSNAREVMLKALANIDTVRAALVAISPTARISTTEIRQRQPWEYGTALPVSDIVPVTVVVTTIEGYE